MVLFLFQIFYMEFFFSIWKSLGFPLSLMFWKFSDIHYQAYVFAVSLALRKNFYPKKSDIANVEACLVLLIWQLVHLSIFFFFPVFFFLEFSSSWRLKVLVWFSNFLYFLPYFLISVLFSLLYSNSDYYQILGIMPCAVQYILIAYI